MSAMPEPSTTLAGAAGGAAVMGAGALLLRWLAGREITRLDKTLESHDARLASLEQNVAKRSDIDVLRGEAHQAHRERMDELRRLHERIDWLVEQKRP